MAQFGMPQRTAADDANAGVVNPPAKQISTRGTHGTSNKSLSGSDKAMDALGQGLGSSLGGALSRMVDNATEEINTNRIVDAQSRQGLETAINEVDQVKKRTGWEKGVFGENIEYRAAQQRATENVVQNTHNETLANIDGYAQDTPEQFHKMQQAKNKEALKQYADDPETKAKVQAALAASGQKLAGAHYKSHYAYNQMQQQETERVRIQQTLDGFNIEASTLLTPEAKAEQLKSIESFLNGSSKPEGMTDVAHRALTLEVVKTNMAAGNAGAMLAMQALGKDKGFSAAEQASWDHAVAQYDTHFGKSADLIRTTADINIAEAITVEQVEAAVAAKDKELTELFKRSSGSLMASQHIARGNLDLAQNEASLRKQAQAREDALVKAAEQAVTAQDKDVIALMGIASESMKQSIALAVTDEDKQAAVDRYNAEVAQFVNLLSPEIAVGLKKEKLDTTAAKAQESLNIERQRTQEAADKKSQELADQAARDQRIAKYFATNDPNVKAGINRDEVLTKKEKEDGFDTHLVDGAQKFIGGDQPPTTEEFGAALAENHKLQSWVLGEIKRHNTVPIVMKEILSNITTDTSNFFDESGNATDQGKAVMKMADKMLTSEKAVSMIGGKDAMRRWRLVSNNIKAGSGKLAVEKRLDAYNLNKGTADTAAFSWKPYIGKGTKRQWMANKLSELDVKNASEQQITTALDDYQIDLVTFGYDVKEADKSLQQNTWNDKTTIFNSNLYDAGFLNDAAGRYSFEDLVRKADNIGALAGVYTGIDPKGEVIKNRFRVPNLQFYTEDGKDGVFLTSPSANGSTFMSTKMIRQLATKMQEADDLDKETKERRGNFRMKGYEANAYSLTQ